MLRVIAGVLLGVTLLTPAVPAQPQPSHASQSIDCTECHTCLHPSGVNPCLKPTLCPRSRGTMDYDADLGPSIVILDALEHLYEPVRFDHEAHARMVRFDAGCATCHHFTPPNSEHPACKGCHPADIPHEDIAQPGLKGAYHRSCLGCHREWDVDTACEICHARKKTDTENPPPADAHAHYMPLIMEDLIFFPTTYEEGDRVPFHHRNHAEMYERDCSECHEHQSCKQCHMHSDEARHPMGQPESTDLHQLCFRCHHEENCEDCHGRDPGELFSHASTGWPLKSYHKKLNCCACHAKRGALLRLDPRCEKCHTEGWNPETFDHRVTGVRLDEIHQEADCTDCHVDGIGKGSSCDACHDDGRTYSSVGFPD